ncbi:hypothetical protein GCM10027347_16470 [Larkinella harenae]
MRKNKEADADNQVIQRPDAKDPAQVKVANGNGAGYGPFLQKQVGNQKTAEYKKEHNTQFADQVNEGKMPVIINLED